MTTPHTLPYPPHTSQQTPSPLGEGRGEVPGRIDVKVLVCVT